MITSTVPPFGPGTAVIDDEHFVARRHAREYGERGRDGVIDVALLVVHREEQREGVGGCALLRQRPLMLRNLCTRLPCTSAV